MLLRAAESRLFGQRGAQGAGGAGRARVLHGWLLVGYGGDH
jgi:hypothetical protein